MLRESRVAEWWPAAVFVGFVVAAAAVVAVLLVSGGRGELQRRSAQPQASARTTVAPSSTAPSCAPSGPQPTGERTLFDDLADGASMDDPNFEVRFEGGVADNSAGAHADLTLDMSVRAGDVAPKAFSILLPSQWGITPGCQIPVRLAIGNLRWGVLLGRTGNPCNEPRPLLIIMLNATTDPTDTGECTDSYRKSWR